MSHRGISGDDVLFGEARRRVGHALCPLAVIGHEDEAGRLDVEAAHGEEPRGDSSRILLRPLLEERLEKVDGEPGSRLRSSARPGWL